MSGGELLVLLVIALLALGAHRLPDAGRTVGQGLRDVQRALNEARRSMQDDAGDPPAPPRHNRLID
jgi:sec-independent protein translocase protein TatA